MAKSDIREMLDEAVDDLHGRMSEGYRASLGLNLDT